MTNINQNMTKNICWITESKPIIKETYEMKEESYMIQA